MTKEELIKILEANGVPDDATIDVRLRVVIPDLEITGVGYLKNVYYDKASNTALIEGEKDS